MKREQFEERFEVDDNVGGTGAYMLSSHGCFQRHDTPRNEQNMSIAESEIKNFEVGNYVEHDDQRLLSHVAELAALGISDINPTETLACFVLRHADSLNNPWKRSQNEPYETIV